MAITVAKDENDKNKPPVYRGASGGNSCDGDNVSKFASHDHIGVEGIVSRGAKGDHERFVEAEKFQKSKLHADKMKPEDFEKAKEKADKEVDAKPTTPGAEVSRLEAGHGQSAKSTKADEKADLDAAKKDTK